MGKVKALFIKLKEKHMSNLPAGAEYDRNAPWNQPDYGMKDCPECDGTGIYSDLSDCCNYPIRHGICSLCGEHAEPMQCNECLGTGKIPRTEEDEEKAEHDHLSSLVDEGGKNED